MKNPYYLFLKQFIKFGLVGFFNTIVDLGILNVLIFSTGLGREGGRYFTLFKSLSFICAATNSYVLNKYWVFRSEEDKGKVLQISKFFLITCGGGLINIVIASLVVTYIPVILLPSHLWPTFGALCGTAIGMVWNFSGYKYLVFREKKSPQKSL